MSGSGATDPLTFTNQNPKVAVRRNTFGRFSLGQKYLCCKIACISNSEKIFNFNQHFIIIIHLFIQPFIHSAIYSFNCISLIFTKQFMVFNNVRSIFEVSLNEDDEGETKISVNVQEMVVDI